MRIILATLTLVAVMLAQQPAARTTGQLLSGQSIKDFTSSAEVTALIAKAKSTRKEGQANVTQPLLQFAPYTATLEYRASVGPAAVHEKDAEMFYVIDGSATLITGGKLVGETRNGANLSGTSIEGGESRAVAKGDFFVVPENTPHWFSAIGGTVVLMTIKMPRGGTP